MMWEHGSMLVGKLQRTGISNVKDVYVTAPVCGYLCGVYVGAVCPL